MPSTEDEDENVCRMSAEIHTGKSQLQQQRSKKKKNNPRMSLASVTKSAITRAAISLKSIKVTQHSTAQFGMFVLKVGALELLRRGIQHRFPPLWWIIQAIPLFRTPPLVWLQRWAPFRYLIQGAQVFSKPVVFLSIATTITNAWDQATQSNNNVFPETAIARPPSRPPTPQSPVQNREDTQMTLRKQLEDEGVILPDRISNDDLQRFMVAANGNMKKFIALVKKNVGWRENFRFLSLRELEEYSQLVYWHQEDSKGRPVLIIRLGVASSRLISSQRPRFAQAIVSQIEYGVENLLNGEDRRLIVILDCAGAPSVGFPLQLTKSCCVLVQENYPTRLVSLFIVNLPPFVRVLVNAIVQIIKPGTRDKIFIESDNCAPLLAEHLGGMNWVPIFLGGDCKCSTCNEARTLLDEETHQHLEYNQHSYNDLGEEEQYEEATPYESCTGVIRVAIIGLLMLWILVALIGGLYDLPLPPDQLAEFPALPT